MQENDAISSLISATLDLKNGQKYEGKLPKGIIYVKRKKSDIEVCLEGKYIPPIYERIAEALKIHHGATWWTLRRGRFRADVMVTKENVKLENGERGHVVEIFDNNIGINFLKEYTRLMNLD